MNTIINDKLTVPVSKNARLILSLNDKGAKNTIKYAEDGDTVVSYHDKNEDSVKVNAKWNGGRIFLYGPPAEESLGSLALSFPERSFDIIFIFGDKGAEYLEVLKEESPHMIIGTSAVIRMPY